MKFLIPALFVVLCLVSTGCTAPSVTNTTPPVTAAPISDNGFVLNDSVRPGDDFYAYVNDGWMEANPVPADKKRYGAFDELQDKVNDDIHTLLENASDAPEGTVDRNITLIGQFYRSGMDNATIGQEGLRPLSGDLAMIDAIATRADLTNATITLMEHGSGPVYTYNAEVNPKNSSVMIVYLWQGGLGLPDRDYYLRSDNTSRKIQDAYKAHIARVLVLAGEPASQAGADAETIYAMEKDFAASHFSSEECQDPQKTTNLYDPAKLEEQYPAMGWQQLFAIRGSGPVNVVDVGQPSYVQELDKMLRTAPLEDWKVYLKYRLLDDASPYLDTSFEQEHFAFYSTTLNGIGEMQPRWKRVVDAENDLLGNAVGQAYVARYVDPRTRGMVTEMFQNLRATFDARIANVSWMSNTTKTAARGKLAAMGEKIAYPDRWQDYAGLNLSESYIGNARAVAAYNLVHGPSGLDKIGGPVDRTAWYMSPQTVNAYYNPTMNEIVFPAAILQFPFFDPDADPAVNYGGLGFVIGHEMTHGFDNAGRQYDKDGNLRDWWTAEDAARFDNLTGQLVTQYNSYEVLPGLYSNGNLTLGENIADFGGLTLAYHAWKNTGIQGADTGAANTTRDREFFYSAARIWRQNIRDEALRNQVYTDPHTTARYRVNGVLFNIPEFYETFPEIQPGDALYRNASVRPVIW